MKINRILFLTLIHLYSFSNSQMIEVDVEPARLIPHVFHYHFKDYGLYLHTQSSLWFEKPNIVHIDMEIYHYAWNDFKEQAKIKLTEEQAITSAQIRMQDAVNKIAANFKLPYDSYKVNLKKTAVNKYEAPPSWINFKLE